MPDFWSPYADFNEARVKLCRLADAAAGPACGVSFSDGHSICVLRQVGAGDRDLWLNVLCQHVAAPAAAPPSPRSSGALGKL